MTAPDLRGHGLSPRTDSFGFQDYAADVLAIGDGWDAVVGHSLGGAVAVTAQAGNPDWASGLVLQDPALTMGPTPRSEVIEWLTDGYRKPPTPAAVAAANPRWHPDDVLTKVKATEQSSVEMVLATIADVWPWNVLDDMAKIAAPTVILGSDPAFGALVPVDLGESLATQMPNVTYEMIPGSSHSAHRDADLYADYLAALIAALDRLPSLGGNTSQGA